MAAFAASEAARLSVHRIEAHSMRFTFVATGQFSLDPAFRFGLTASSLTQSFGREQSNSTGGTSTRVATGFTGALAWTAFVRVPSLHSRHDWL